MNKTKIKNFSIWARRNLIEVVAYRMRFLGIDENGIKPQMEGSTDNLKLYDMGTSKPAEVAGEDIEKRVNLANHIKDHEKTSDYKTAYETMVEEIAYTWFNRLIAIRFMEVNDYLPSGVRVLSSESGKREPDIVTKAVEVAEDQGFSITKEEIWKLKEENKLDELFRIMFIQQCKKLHEILPELFDNSKDDYTELLLPISFIDDDAFIRHLVTDIDEADFNISEQGQVEIIGWLYQYYNTEKKDAVFAAMSNKVKVSKENIAAATQLFTPDWIVRYMVENSLGRIFIDKRKREGVYADGRGLDELTWDEFESQRIKTEQFIADQMGWKYYLPEAAQSPDVAKQLEELWKEQPNLNLEQIRFIDPCMGSGHILVYAFDVFMQMYISRGYTERDAAQNIVRHNLWGLDLDKRAYQLAYFAVMMKARQYDKRLWHRIENKEFDAKLPNLSHFQDLPRIDYSLLDDTMASFVKQFENADTYGSLITIQADDEIDSAIDAFQGIIGFDRSHLEHFMQLYKILSQRYDVVCTNPPYMASDKMNSRLKDFITKNFTDYKSDFFSAFVIRCSMLAKNDGYLGFLTPYVWMFIQSYEKLRQELYTNKTIETLIQFEYSAFEEATVPICTFAIRNNHLKHKKGCYLRLTDFRGGMEIQRQKALEAIINHRCGFYYESATENFGVIPGSPVAYWASKDMQNVFERGTKLSDIGKPKQGMATADNGRFVRCWYEVSALRLSFNGFDKWYPYNNGGGFRKWYGFNIDIVNWENSGAEIKAYPKAYVRNETDYFKPGITWNAITSSDISVRCFDEGFIFSNAGMAIFTDEKYRKYLLSLINSCVSKSILKIISPTLNYNAGDICNIPVIYDDTKVSALADRCIALSKADWDSFETSWDFKEHPFVKWSKKLWDCTAIGAAMSHYYGKHIEVSCPLELCFMLWQGECNERFNKLKANEEELNRIFIDIYGLQDELTPEVEDKDVTVRKADLQRDMRSFVSYAVGCMFGRYSLDREGLVFAGGDFDRVYWKHKGQAPLDENGNVPEGCGYAGVSSAPYNYPCFWSDTADWGAMPKLRFAPDADNCLPITEEHFFEDDIVTQFVDFVKAVFGEESLENNLRYVAENLGIKGNGTAREKIRQYFLKEFFKDHCKVYQKRPIYWLFDTGKKNGFKALCYVHRWTVNTVGSVRIDYMHKLQRLYRNEIIRLKENIDAGEEIAKSQKRLEKITNQLQETEEYDAKIGIVVAARTEIDLDDGVKVNYDKVQVGSDGKHYQILAKI